MKMLEHERLFDPFLDVVDGLVCVSASICASGLERQIASHGLRFPLVLDPEAPLSVHVATSGFTPASSRFGPFCDNITGMNWELPDKRRVRIGERVVKSTTGYDLLRFLLGTDTRFGHALDYVLRLRPSCGGGGLVFLEGSPLAQERAAAEILKSDFLHWFESVDWVGGRENAAPRLRIGVHCPPGEWRIFVDYLSTLANTNGLKATAETGNGSVVDGLPDLVLKTTVEQVIPLAREITLSPWMRCTALCYNAVVHVYVMPGADLAGILAELVARFSGRLHEIGGDWHSRHLGNRISSQEEEAWIGTLAKDWGFAS